jgi:hypothetical protein
MEALFSIKDAFALITPKNNIYFEDVKLFYPNF